MASLSNMGGVGRQDLTFTSSFMSGNVDQHCDSLYEQATRRFGLGQDKVENILPCTPFQRDVVDCAADDARRAVGHVVYEIPSGYDLQRLAAAWKEIVSQTPALRTYIFKSKAGESFQVVLANSFFVWMYVTSLDMKEAVVQDEAAAAMAGPRCNRYIVIEDPSTKQRWLIWTFHHALVDNSLQEHILARVLTVYEGGHVHYSNGSEVLANPHVGDMERATQFWKQHFDSLDASVFPRLPSYLTMPYPSTQSEYHIIYPGLVQQKWSNEAVCRAALAVLLARYTHASEALFGVVTQRPHMQGVTIDGPTRTVVPIRVVCAPDQSVSDIIGAITSHDTAMREFEQTGLCNIRDTGDDGSAACGFQTVLLVTAGDASQSPSSELHQNAQEWDRFVPCTNRALLLKCSMANDSALLTARYDSSVIDTRQMNRFLMQLGGLIQQFQSRPDDLPLNGQLDVVTQDDRAEIEKELPVNKVCIHDVISQRAADAPQKAAVSAWDGEWTYAELEDVSSRLAQHIQSVELGQGQVVLPLCFEKSKWVVAGMLAVLKAGRAFTLLDPSNPPARTAQVCRQTSARVALTSKLHSSTMRDFVDRCIVIDDDFYQSLPSDEGRFQPTAKPEDLAYVLFTSGSTGEPKGSMIEHRGFAPCALKFGSALGINNHTRALQFASYAFGACLLEVVTTLIQGGCVCIPSDDDRMNNVPAFITWSKVNWALLTPSFIGTIQPESVPGLQTLVLVGEPMSALMRETWAPRVQLLNGYGQSESSTISSVTKVNSFSVEPNNIGRAVGSRFWVTDPNEPNRLAPIGCIGELVIESPGIARGYIVSLPQDNTPFLSTPPSWYPSSQLPEGVKFYRTGDLVCYRSDGTVVYLGRRDSQVKIRGQRVETSGVEACLRQQLPSHIMAVADAVRRPNSYNSTVLVAFLIGFKRDEDSLYAISEAGAHILDTSVAQSINMKLQRLLPQHSVPTYYIRMKDLPRTATGKTDRRGLRSIASELLSTLVQSVAPQPSGILDPSATSTEAKVRELWFRGLNLHPNSNTGRASFFELGGDSIAAIKMVNMARLAGMALSVSDIFHNPTLAGLIDVIGRGSAPYSPIPTTTCHGPVEQSFAQGRIWFLDQLKLDASWYLIPYGVRMRGPLRIEALTIALKALEQRHETLRTTFEEQDGVGMQVVHGSLMTELRVIDVSDDQNGGYIQSLHEEQSTPFDLTSEVGWRVSLLRLGGDDHILSIVMHHIISDGWSIDILRQELGQFYSAALRGQDPLSVVSPLPIHYRDFSIWQKQEYQVAEHQRQLEYWSNQLADSTPAEFLTDLPRPAILSGQAGFVPVTIDGALYRELREFCKAHQMTSFAVLLAAFRAAHYRLTGAEDATIGSPIANRNRRELENIIGFFVNTQCMRIRVDSDDTFESLVRQVRSTATAAFEHQDVPFERVVSALLPGSRDTSRNPLVQLIFAVHSQRDLGKFELEGLEGESMVNATVTRFDVEFHLFQEEDKLSGKLVFAADLFTLEDMTSVVNVFFQILRQGLDQPQTPIAVLPLTDGLAELRDMGLLEIERAEYPRQSSVVDVFRVQVAARSHALAVIDSSARLTYAELDRQSDQLAAWLRQRNMPAETLVAVLAPRSCETVVAFLGILKSNLAYLPLDFKNPAARLEAILSTLSQRKLVLVGSDTATPEVKLPDVELVRISDTLEHRDSDDINGHADLATVMPSAKSLAYVIFTSGSTGRPKGVMIEHRSIIRLASESSIISKFPLAAKVAHLSNIAFDAATWEIYAALLNGGTLVCIDYMTTLDSKALEAVFAREQVQAALFTPALLKHCLADAPATLGTLDILVLGGDRLDGQDAIAAQALVRTGAFNAYGPTENGVISTIYEIAENDSFINGVPIGRAISNSGSYIMDTHQQLVPTGVMGELVVTGDGLARGYTDPTLDTDRFIQVTIDGQAVRAYRTGDRVRYRAGDGQIEFFGRMDQQIKIRGHRIEPAEVERAILSHSSVCDAVVVIHNQEGQDAEMVGFVVTRGDHTTELEEARNHVEGWGDHFEGGTYADLDTVSQSVIGNDFKGWTSMYDGSEINKVEMQEWLDDTIYTLLDGQAAGRVLEIGTGSGKVLFNLGTGLQSYVGLEPSRAAATFVNNAIKSTPTLASKAQVHVGTAMDVGGLSGLCPDQVVLNSVVQYFPTPEYLEEVVDTLARIPGVTRLFFGDIRSHATNRHFLAARSLHALGNKSTKESVRERMAEVEEREEELLVDPAFFTALQRRLPDQVKHVEILPKKMQATSELSAYQYTAVVHVHSPEEREQPVYPINPSDWIDFQASELDRDALLRLLQHSPDAPTVAISNIPYSKTILERHVVESLDNDSEDNPHGSLDGAAWISAVRSNAERCASLSVTDLVQIAEEAGFRAEVSCARQWSQRGGLDAVFHHYSPAQKGARVLIQFPTDDQSRGLATLANRPLQRLQSRRFVSQIREDLRAVLPVYMIPARIVVIDQMPLNANGKVDRKELTRRAQIAQKPEVAFTHVAPLNEIEVVLCEEFADVFGIDVGVNDHFFKLGGHSLMATKLVARISRRLDARVSVKHVFDQPVVADLAATIRQVLTEHSPILNTQHPGHLGKVVSARVAPRNELEAMLCKEFVDVLGIDVGITDNFFDLGGHSLMALKLAARVSRRLDAPISVKDIFEHPVPLRLASTIQRVKSKADGGTNGVPTAENVSFQLLPLEDPQAFIQREIFPQLEYPPDQVLDIYPATQMQKLFLRNSTTGRPWTITPFCIDFPPDSDCATLTTACTSLIAHFDMFRTVFLVAADELYQVVLKHIDVPIEIIETEENINSATRAFVGVDLQQPVRLGQPLLRIAFLKKRDTLLRVMLRMSHALYDGLSLEYIVRSLHALYNGRSLPTSPSFSRYMQHMADSRREGYEFWGSVLQDSSITAIESDGSAHEQVARTGTCRTSKSINVPLQASADSSITPATIFTTACALMLMKETGLRDILFGRIVSGRQGLPITSQNIVGPCTNEIPVRVCVDENSNPRKLLRTMQDQYLDSLPFETLGFDELKKNCSRWPEATKKFGCCIVYQNFDFQPESKVEERRVQIGVLARAEEVVDEASIHDLVLAGEPEVDGPYLHVTVVANRQICKDSRVKNMLEKLCETIQTLSSALRDPRISDADLTSQELSLVPPVGIPKARTNGFIEHNSSENRIYVLGVGNLGKLVAHALRKRHPQLPITLLLHRADLVSEWDAAGRAITCVTNDIFDTTTGFDIEFLSDSLDNMVPIKHLIVATKTYMTASALDLVKGRLGSTSSILFLQNGMGTLDEVSASAFSDVKSRPTYWTGVCSCGVYRTSPFTIVHAGRGPIVLAPTCEASNDSPEHASAIPVVQDFMIQRLLETPDLEITLTTPPKIKEVQLQKFIVNAMINPLTAVFRCKNGQLFCQPARLSLMRMLLEEAGEIVRAVLPRASEGSGPSPLSHENLLAAVLRVAEMTGECTSSMLQDVQAGQRTEIDDINGYIALQGQRLGLPYTHNETLVTMVKQGRVLVNEDIQPSFPTPRIQPIDIGKMLDAGLSKGAVTVADVLVTEWIE
ncbi:non-ribosomal peptide synthetase [Xylaria palmicola]|nr:non-ribosomal peptide synthetase [Xylaria palmicola]